MVRLRALENDGGQSAVITADGAVVGGISLRAPGAYTVDTKGRVPAIDGLTGRTPFDAWGEVVRQVQAGGVQYIASVQIGPYNEEN